MIERVKRPRRPSRSGDTALRTACVLKPRRYELVRKWRLQRAPLPFSRLSLCLLGRQRGVIRVDTARTRFDHQSSVRNSVRLFSLRHNFNFTILLSRFERNTEIRYAPVRTNTLRRPPMREVFTGLLPSFSFHVPVGSSRSSYSAGAETSVKHVIGGAGGRENLSVQHTFFSARRLQAGGAERMSFKPVQSRSMGISHSLILRLPSVRQSHAVNEQGWTHWPITTPVITTLLRTAERLMKHSGTNTFQLRQPATVSLRLREAKTFSVARRHSTVRKTLDDSIAPPAMRLASAYRPINVEHVSRQVSTRSSSAPAAGSLGQTQVASHGNHPEITTRWETREKEINEKIHQQVERTVREQVERTFRTDTVLVQRLSREIQSDLYRGIVSERERLGLR